MSVNMPFAAAFVSPSQPKPDGKIYDGVNGFGPAKDDPVAAPDPAQQIAANTAPIKSAAWYDDAAHGGDISLRHFPVLLRNVIEEVSARNQIDKSIVAYSVIAAVNFCTQSLADVKHPQSRSTFPASLFLMCIAPSGDRKTTADKSCHAGLKHYSEEGAPQYNAASRAYYAAMKAAKKSPKDGEEAPPEPQPLQGAFTWRLSDANPEGLTNFYKTIRCDAGQFTSEGISIFSGIALRAENIGATLSNWTKLWDGEAIGRTRQGVGHIELFDRRLSQFIQVQPVAAGPFLGSSVVQGQGYGARVLVTSPETMIGKRRFALDTGDNRVTLHQDKFAAELNKLAKCIRRPPPDDPAGHTNLPQIVTAVNDPGVTDLLQSVYEHFEAGSAKGGQYHEIAPSAQRAVENMLRVAATFALFRNRTRLQEVTPHGGSYIYNWFINSDDLSAGASLVYHSMQTKLRLLGISARSELDDHAATLIRWMKAAPYNGTASLDHITRLGPSKTRSLELRQKVLKQLTESGDLVASATRPLAYTIATL